MARAMERANPIQSSCNKFSLHIQDNCEASLPNHVRSIMGQESGGSSPRSPKKVSWVPGTVDNEGLPKKSFEKEFYFSQDIWG
ncbi:protein MpPP1I6 [Marchantia polymorpha subsp. ruderalis]|uniref:Uncharacterized protein n=2 Tax=Marchantia polymorpha TaxID=3197 RepID=A0AAF6BVL6_MARPO|nr:hypothetical protein MARPO_0074s0087 [Marchantia polymorpha]BBN16050.1 hypothetical protein Mp_7g03090 [Marchantia polymorpha subsp. ruderalis]|eukprot:PTQ35115.1 hypothetical protein MARPO_0074s0087 [Marchantia polymorpha]